MTKLTEAGYVPRSFEDALEHISTEPENHSKKNYASLKPSLDTIHAYAENRGLPNKALTIVIDAITRRNLLDQGSQNALIRSSYPGDRLPSDLLCIVIGSLGHGACQASMPTQQLLLQWIMMVSDYLEEPSSLSTFYSVLFNLLDITNLRANSCHVLAIITRRQHVRPFRIQMLQDLWKSVGPEPALLRLMHVYDKYAPGILDPDLASKPSGKFLHPDPEWALRLANIQQRSGSQPISRDMKGYVDRIEKTDMSDLKPADLRDRTVQRDLLLAPAQASQTKIDECLSSPLEEQFKKLSSGQNISRSLSEILNSTLAYARYSKVSMTRQINV